MLPMKSTYFVLLALAIVLLESGLANGYHRVNTVHLLSHPYKTELYTAELERGSWRYYWCADYITLEDASVLCNDMRQYHSLGQYNTSSSSRVEFGALAFEPAVPEAFMNETFACTGRESTLSECPLRPVGDSLCPSGTIGQVDCYPADNANKNLTASLLGLTPDATAGVVYLTSSPRDRLRRLAGMVCNENGTSWGDRESRVACRSMGYDDTWAWTVDPAVVVNTTSLSGQTYVIKDVHCEGTEATLNDCVHTDMCQSIDFLDRSFDCPETCNGEPAAVMCSPP